MNERTAELQELMKQHNLKVKDVAELLERKENTVHQWRQGTMRIIPDFALTVLKLKLTRK